MKKPRDWKLNHISDTRCFVLDAARKVVAELVKTNRDRWKIVGEDVYANSPQDLLVRLKKRATWN